MGSRDRRLQQITQRVRQHRRQRLDHDHKWMEALNSEQLLAIAGDLYGDHGDPALWPKGWTLDYDEESQQRFHDGYAQYLAAKAMAQ